MPEDYFNPDWNSTARTCRKCESSNIETEFNSRVQGNSKKHWSGKSNVKMKSECLDCGNTWEGTKEHNVKTIDG